MTHSAATAAATAAAAFSELSKKLTKSLSKEEKKNGGIFFTPPACVVDIISRLRLFERSFDTILEPSCGSGEFISALVREYPRANITGVEYNHDIYTEVSQHFSAVTNVRIQHSDFLTHTTHDGSVRAPDLIIGNPPYYVMKKEEVAPEYYPFFDGRPNIFILFIIKSAKLLREGGVLCFVLPASFMNSQYYDKTRKYIVRNFTILHIAKCDNGGGYLETQQETFVLMIQKRAPPPVVTEEDDTGATPTTSGGGGGGGGVFEKSGATIFTFNLPRLAELYAGSRSLYELGFKVSVGTVVWNQCKNILTNDGTKTRLIYSSNIEDGKFVHKTYKNTEKKAFIDKPASGGGAPMIVLNRGYGVGEYKFNYCLITPESVSSQEYLIENHLICITRIDTDAATPIAEFQHIIRSFQDSRTREFIACYCANNAMNTTELNHMLPIYDI